MSAPSSGHGKTAVSVGLLAAVAARGLRATGFKIGPDYVDAAYLGLAAGTRGRNLDPRLVGSERLAPLFAHGAAGTDLAVVEGTMGLYDGLAGRTDAESTAQVASALKAPVILVIDVAAMGQSVAALVHGFRAYDEVMWLGGVILNRIDSDRHEHVLREALADLGVPVLGALRRRALSGLGHGGGLLPPRHEGVGPVAQGTLEAARAVRRLGETVARSVDLERLVAVARSAPDIGAEAWSGERALGGQPVPGARPPVIAVAGGPLLPFCYPETIELLHAAGAEVVVLDPIRDTALPPQTAGVVIGGALPEAYVEELSVNEPLRTSVAAFARSGRPVVAEGAGLVWLCKEFAGRPMCGVLDATARVGDMVVLGYRSASAMTDSVLTPMGTRVIGHKLHRTVVTPRSGPKPAWSWQGGPPEGFVMGGVHASYLGLHWAGVPEAAARVVAAARAAESAAPMPTAGPASSAGTAPPAGPVQFVKAAPAEAPEPEPEPAVPPVASGGGVEEPRTVLLAGQGEQRERDTP